MGVYYQATAGFGFEVTREDLLRAVEEFSLMPEGEVVENYGQDELAELVAKRFELEYVVAGNFYDSEGQVALGFFDVVSNYGLTGIGGDYGLTGIGPIGESRKIKVVRAAVEMGIKDSCQHYIGLSVL